MNPIKFYFDEHIPHRVARQLRTRGIEVILAAEIGMISKDDDMEHLPTATEMGAVVFTHDHPFAGRTANRTDHAGLICWTGGETDIGGMVKALSQFAERYSADEVAGQVFWLK